MSGIRYRILERLGKGRSAEVFRAVAIGERGFEKPVAIKRMLAALIDDERSIEQFAAEARLVCQLKHPSIVEVLDFG